MEIARLVNHHVIIKTHHTQYYQLLDEIGLVLLFFSVMNVLLMLLSYFLALLSYSQYFLSSIAEKPSIGVRSETLEEMCQKILEITSSANESKIIINNSIGGLGHKSISVVEGILYSLIARKQLWCMKCTYFTI